MPQTTSPPPQSDPLQQLALRWLYATLEQHTSIDLHEVDEPPEIATRGRPLTFDETEEVVTRFRQLRGGILAAVRQQLETDTRTGQFEAEAASASPAPYYSLLPVEAMPVIANGPDLTALANWVRSRGWDVEDPIIPDYGWLMTIVQPGTDYRFRVGVKETVIRNAAGHFTAMHTEQFDQLYPHAGARSATSG